MKLNIFNDGIGYVTDDMSSIKTANANLNEKNRIKFVTDLAAVSRGKEEAKNPEKRYIALLKEAAPVNYDTKEGTPSRPLEFLPVRVLLVQEKDSIIICGVTFTLEEFSNSFGGNMGYLSKKGTVTCEYPFSYLYTNMRALLISGIPYKDIPYNEQEDIKDFVALKAMIPMFIWAQVPNTHTMISKEAQSDRVTENVNYWLPTDIITKITDLSVANLPVFDEIGILATFLLEAYDASEVELPFNLLLEKTLKDYYIDADVMLILSSFLDYSKEQAANMVIKYNKGCTGWLPVTLKEKFNRALGTDNNKRRDLSTDIPVKWLNRLASTEDTGRDCLVYALLNNLTQADAMSYFKELGYPKEIYNRTMYYFKYKEVVMTGWNNNPKVWEHLFIERSTKEDIWKNWTQQDTKLFVEGMKQIIEGV